MHNRSANQQSVDVVPACGSARRFRIVVLGGGTGTSTALSGLRSFDVDLTAVVSVMDSGGSSGRLRSDYGFLPPGDARQCLMALANDDESAELLRILFTYRFRSTRTNGTADCPRPLDDHNLGNLLISALTDITGSVESAYAWVGRLLGARGQVIPVTTSDVQLCARLTDGRTLSTEAAIDTRADSTDAEIDYVFLDRPAYPSVSALAAVRAADLVIIGPGDLYTSVVPNLLVQNVAEAIACACYRVLVVNLMTKPGETDGYRASTFVERLKPYLDPASLDACLVNTGSVPQRILDRYATHGSFPVEVDRDAIEAMDIEVVAGDLASTRHDYQRHDPVRLASTLYDWLDRRVSSDRRTQVVPVSVENNPMPLAMARPVRADGMAGAIPARS